MSTSAIVFAVIFILIVGIVWGAVKYGKKLEAINNFEDKEKTDEAEKAEIKRRNDAIEQKRKEFHERHNPNNSSASRNP